VLLMNFWATVSKTVRRMLSDRCLSVCLSVCPVCDVGVLGPNGLTDQVKMKLGMQVGLGPGHFVLDGDPDPPPQKGAEPPTPKFSAHVYCDQTARWMKLILGVVVGLSLGEFVLDGDPAPPPKGTEPLPNFKG